MTEEHERMSGVELHEWTTAKWQRPRGTDAAFHLPSARFDFSLDPLSVATWGFIGSASIAAVVLLRALALMVR